MLHTNNLKLVLTLPGEKALGEGDAMKMFFKSLGEKSSLLFSFMLPLLLGMGSMSHI